MRFPGVGRGIYKRGSAISTVVELNKPPTTLGWNPAPLEPSGWARELLDPGVFFADRGKEGRSPYGRGI